MVRVKTIEKTVKSLVAKGLMLEPDVITRETSLVNDLNADSMDIVNVVTAIEAKYKITLPDDFRVDYNRYTVQFLIDCVISALNEKNTVQSRRKMPDVKAV